MSSSFSAKSKWNRKIEFEGGNGVKGPKLEEVEGRIGCYSIGGKVNVLQVSIGHFQFTSGKEKGKSLDTSYPSLLHTF